MGFLTHLTKTVLDVATTPIDIAKDIATFGGDEEETATVKKLKKILEDISDLPDSVDDGIM